MAHAPPFSPTAATPCPLCDQAETRDYHQDRRRPYLQCPRCDLVFVPPLFHPTPAEERAEYDLHDNRPDDPGYRRFLSRLFEPMVDRLRAGGQEPSAQGLDFGCGPGPTLSVMFEEKGFAMDIFDPFYAPDCPWQTRSYDFITATEVVEHLHHPGRELDRLWTRLRPGGYLGLMTKRVQSRDAFSRWHYKNDRTHVAFFSEATFFWLARHWNADFELTGPDTVMFEKR